MNVGVMGEPFRRCSEVPNASYCVLRKEGCTEAAKVEPLIGGITNCAIVEIEAIYINVGRQYENSPKNATTALRRSRAQSPQRLGGSLNNIQESRFLSSGCFPVRSACGAYWKNYSVVNLFSGKQRILLSNDPRPPIVCALQSEPDSNEP